MTDDQLHAQCLAAVEAFRVDNPMTDAQAARMVLHVADLVRELEYKKSSLRIMAESLVRKQRETVEMTDLEALVRVHHLVEFLLRDE